MRGSVPVPPSRLEKETTKRGVSMPSAVETRYTGALAGLLKRRISVEQKETRKPG